MNKRMINNLSRYWSVAIVTLLLVVGCSKEDGLEEMIETETEGAVILLFTASSGITTSSRTVLPGSDNAQHVTDVQLYIFDPAGKCVASEDVGWREHFTAGGNILPTITAEMHYKVKYKCTPSITYTFLAVGRDETSSATYNFPGAITIGTSLENLNAKLATNTNWQNIRYSEFFTGKELLTPTLTGLTGRIDLYRRVAGVMGWFTNVPSAVNGTAVKNIVIALYTKQNTEVPLIALEQTPFFKDYVESPSLDANADILVTIPAPTPGNSTVTVSGGSYVLPIPAPAPSNDAQLYTLQVRLTDETGKTLKTLRVKLPQGDELDGSTSGGTGIIDTQAAYRFPIIANHFYGIGSKDKPVDIGGGDNIVITVNPGWEGITDLPLE